MPFSTCIIPFQNMLYIIMSKIKQTKRENTKSVHLIIVNKYLSIQAHRYSIRQSQAFRTLEYKCTGNILSLADGVETSSLSPCPSITHHTHAHACMCTYTQAYAYKQTHWFIINQGERAVAIYNLVPFYTSKFSNSNCAHTHTDTHFVRILF